MRNTCTTLSPVRSLPSPEPAATANEKYEDLRGAGPEAGGGGGDGLAV